MTAEDPPIMSTTVSTPGPIEQILAALRGEDAASGLRILSENQASIPAGAILEAADAMMRSRRWRDAAWLLDRLSGLDTAAQMKRFFSRNLASLAQHRPELYRLMISLPTDGNYRIGPAKTGRPTVIVRTKGCDMALSPGNDPIGSLQQAIAQLRPALESGQPIALCGIGDGYLLYQLAHNPPKLYMDQELPVFVLEPDAQVALQCMMIHDFSGPRGPIEQARFQWFVGAEWEQALRHAVLFDSMLSCPSITVGQGLQTQAIQQSLVAIAKEIAAQDTQIKEQVEAYYAQRNPGALSAICQAKGNRKPRILLLTTRSSTVLQHSTRDIAEAFEELGWETRILIEPTNYHRVYRRAIRQAMAQFKPDLFFQIDHLRCEHDGLFPPNLPFVCWVQDHLSNLMSAQAGRTVGPADFVLSDAGATYTATHEYPARQIIPLTKLTRRIVPREICGSKQDNQIVFVSNASGTPNSLLAAALKTSGGSGRERDFLAECTRRVSDAFAFGGSLSTYLDICDVVRGTEADLKIKLDKQGFHNIARWLTHPLADALYRQQALRWAAEAAEESGLALALYGIGWDQHPEFARFARGPIAYGAALDELTRRSAINLQVVPYLCLHQRLLDGIATGGFFLIRRHQSDVAPQAMLDLLEDVGTTARTLESARKAIPQSQREQFEKLVAECTRCLCSTGVEDPIEMVRSWQEAQVLVAGEGVLPHFEQVNFDDAASLRACIERFMSNPQLRSEVVGEQQRSISQRLTYSAGMSRVLSRIERLLSETAQASEPRLALGRAA